MNDYSLPATDGAQVALSDEDVEVTVVSSPSHAPGFYTSGWRTFYVATDGAIYLVRAPGRRVMLEQRDHLPMSSYRSDERDIALSHLAAAVESVGFRGAPARTERAS